MDWAITAYTDQDPAVGVARDYRGRGYTFDGSTGVHFALADFAAMDRGIDVYAAAAGTVIETHDGEFDRYLNPPATTPDNYVLIDHGDGWRTRYGRLRNGSVVVSVGDVLSAGQKIGLVGGSGNPTANYTESGAFLRFEVIQNGQPVEPFFGGSAFWLSPPPFAGDSPGVHNMFTTTAAYGATDVALPSGEEAWEGISTRHVFHPGDKVYTLAKWHGRNGASTPDPGYMRYRFYDPNGNQIPTSENVPAQDQAQGWRSHTFTLGQFVQLGTWQAAAEINGIEYARTSFEVLDASQGRPEIKLFQDNIYVVDGRTTPLDFGSATQDAAGTARTFTIINHGTSPLSIEQVTLPDGFTLQSPPPATIAGAGGTGTMVVRMETQTVGPRSGRIIIHSNDVEEVEFDFAVKGNVVGIAATVSAGDFLYQSKPQRLRFRFSQNVGGSLSAADLTVERLGPSGGTVAVLEPTYDIFTNTAIFTFAGSGVLPDGNYRATLSAAGVLNGGTPMAADDVRSFFVLTGDLNHDRTVSIADFITLASKFNRTTFDYSDGDVNYDGRVSIADFIDLASNFGTTLAEPAPLVAQAAASSGVLDEIDSSGRDSEIGGPRPTLRERRQATHRRQTHHRRHSRAPLQWKSRGGVWPGQAC